MISLNRAGSSYMALSHYAHCTEREQKPNSLFFFFYFVLSVESNEKLQVKRENGTATTLNVEC